MIEGLKPYAEYKESGLPWLPMIPNGWQTIRNGSLFSQRNETDHPQLPILEVSLRTGVRVRNFETSNRKQLMSPKHENRLHAGIKIKTRTDNDTTIAILRPLK